MTDLVIFYKIMNLVLYMHKIYFFINLNLLLFIYGGYFMKIKKEINIFLKENKLISFIALLSLLIYISYGVTDNLHEIFHGADYIYTLIKDLCLAYLGSYIFYIIQVYLPFIKERKTVSKAILNDLFFLKAHIKRSIYFSLDENQRALDLEDLTFEDFKNLNQKIIKNDKDLKQLNRALEDINDIINKILSIKLNLDTYTVYTLYSIKESRFLERLSRELPYNIVSLYSEDFYKYYNLYCDLCNEIDKQVDLLNIKPKT